MSERSHDAETIEDEDEDEASEPNGAPELAGLDETRAWTGADALDAMRSEIVERIDSLRAEVPRPEGEYGLCIDCGADIPRRRLLATPDLERCTQCDPPELA